MATEADAPSRVDYFLCKRGQMHVWTYLGRLIQAYRCQLCGVRVTKALLQEVTNA